MAIVLPNCPQHIVAFYAVLRLGAIVVEHNPLYTERELRHQFSDHGATIAIVWDKVADSVLAFPGEHGCDDGDLGGHQRRDALEEPAAAAIAAEEGP